MFRFTIRELVLVTLIVAMCLGWIADYRLQLEADAAKDGIAWIMAGYITEQTGRPVIWDDEGVYIDGKYYPSMGTSEPLPNFNRRLARRDAPRGNQFRTLSTSSSD
jgi:hypothetical protein